MTAGVGLFAPMHWYLQELRWSPPGVNHRGTSNIELALDLEAATGVPLHPPGASGTRTLRQKATLFQDAAKRTAALCRSRPTPGDQDRHCHALAGMKWPETSG